MQHTAPTETKLIVFFSTVMRLVIVIIIIKELVRCKNLMLLPKTHLGSTGMLSMSPYHTYYIPTDLMLTASFQISILKKKINLSSADRSMFGI